MAAQRSSSSSRPASPASPTTTTKVKRARTKHACDECRRSQKKCDGEHPTCKRCHQIGTKCNYSPHKSRGHDSMGKKVAEPPQADVFIFGGSTSTSPAQFVFWACPYSLDSESTPNPTFSPSTPLSPTMSSFEIEQQPSQQPFYDDPDSLHTWSISNSPDGSPGTDDLDSFSAVPYGASSMVTGAGVGVGAVHQYYAPNQVSGAAVSAYSTNNYDQLAPMSLNSGPYSYANNSSSSANGTSTNTSQDYAHGLQTTSATSPSGMLFMPSSTTATTATDDSSSSSTHHHHSHSQIPRGAPATIDSDTNGYYYSSLFNAGGQTSPTGSTSSPLHATQQLGNADPYVYDSHQQQAQQAQQQQFYVTLPQQAQAQRHSHSSLSQMYASPTGTGSTNVEMDYPTSPTSNVTGASGVPASYGYSSQGYGVGDSGVGVGLGGVGLSGVGVGVGVNSSVIRKTTSGSPLNPNRYSNASTNGYRASVSASAQQQQGQATNAYAPTTSSASPSPSIQTQFNTQQYYQHHTQHQHQTSSHPYIRPSYTPSHSHSQSYSGHAHGSSSPESVGSGSGSRRTRSSFEGDNSSDYHSHSHHNGHNGQSNGGYARGVPSGNPFDLMQGQGTTAWAQ